MLKFLAAAMGYSDTNLTPAFKTMLSVKRPTGQAFIDSALGWAIDTRGDGEIIWKNGGTGGYRTFIGYSPRTGVGIVALSNASTVAGTDDIGLHLLDARFPLDVPEGSPREATVSANVLDGYVGRYKLGQTAVVTVTREGEQLYAELTGQPRAAIYAKGERESLLQGRRCANLVPSGCPRPCDCVGAASRWTRSGLPPTESAMRRPNNWRMRWRSA